MIKIGDLVRVDKAIENHPFVFWFPGMNDVPGKTGFVTKLDENQSCCKIEELSTLWFPMESLVIVELIYLSIGSEKIPIPLSIDSYKTLVEGKDKPILSYD